jgi:hypothetical protein
MLQVELREITAFASGQGSRVPKGMIARTFQLEISTGLRTGNSCRSAAAHF